MRVLGNLLHVAALPKKQVSEGGIVLLEHYNPDNKQYRVLGVGPKVKEICAGDCVLAHLYTDTKYQFEDGSLLISADQCVAVWTNETPAPPVTAPG